MSAIVHFNSHVHRSNRRNGTRLEALVFRRTRSARAVAAREIRFAGASGRFVYDPDHPLKCGAVAWVEFDSGEVVPATQGATPCHKTTPSPSPGTATRTSEASKSCRSRRPCDSSSATGAAATCRKKTARAV